jgi:hypothetical protein
MIQLNITMRVKIGEVPKGSQKREEVAEEPT